MKKLLVVLLVFLSSVSVCSGTLSVDGVQIEYEMKGKGELVVLFEAGAASGMSGWNSIWGSLPKNIIAIRYSRYGEGGSDPCTGNLTADDYASYVSAILKKLGVDNPITIVAHSYGARVARTYAAKNKGKVNSLLLVDPSNPKDVDIVLEVDPVNGPSEIKVIMENDFEVGAGKFCFLNDLWEKNAEYSVLEIGDIPVTLIAGVKRVDNPKTIFEKDQAKELWGKYQREWLKPFPRGKMVLAHKSGHFVQDDEPDLVLKELDSLLRLTARSNYFFGW